MQAGLPAFAEAAALRLRFWTRRRRGRRALRRALSGCLPALGRAGATEAGLRAARARFLLACLDLLEQAAQSRPDLAAHREELAALAALARRALAGDAGAAATLRDREQEAMGLPAPAGFAARVPGRAVWLAAIAAELPADEGEAAVMLVNDLAVLGRDLPLRALRAAAG
jgi:hypothetical protein